MCFICSSHYTPWFDIGDNLVADIKHIAYVSKAKSTVLAQIHNPYQAITKLIRK